MEDNFCLYNSLQLMPVQDINMDQTKVINLIVNLRKKGIAFREIADRLNEDGIPTCSGKGVWHKGTVYNLLRGLIRTDKGISFKIPKKNKIVKRVTNKSNRTIMRRFRDLPFGTRFSYVSQPDTVWVVLDTLECGLIAKWEGVDGPVRGQHITNFCSYEGETQLQVIVRE